MGKLNYHHLLYFWEVARRRSVSKASRELGVSQPTVSAQLKALEQTLGSALFTRTGRELVLTELGHIVYGYAVEIFTLGRELEDAVATRGTGRPMKLRIGIAASMPKLVAHVLIRPALAIGQPFHLVVREDDHSTILNALAAQQLDIVIANEPAAASHEIKGTNYLLGESGISFFAAGDLVRTLGTDFPKNLHEAPMYLPLPETGLRRMLDDWFAQVGVRPDVVGEFNDIGMLKTFGQGGTAVFPSVTLVEKQVFDQYRARVIGRTEQVRERFFAVASSKRLTHPGVQAICKQPRLLAELVDGMPVTDIGMLKRIAKRLRKRRDQVRTKG